MDPFVVWGDGSFSPRGPASPRQLEQTIHAGTYMHAIKENSTGIEVNTTVIKNRIAIDFLSACLKKIKKSIGDRFCSVVPIEKNEVIR